MNFIKECKQNLTLLSRHMKTLIGFELLYKLLTGALFSPVFYGLFRLSISAAGLNYLNGDNIKNYLQRPLVLLLLLLLMAGLTVVSLIEILAIIHCFHASRLHEPVTVAQMMRAGIHAAARVLNHHNWLLILFVAVVIPLTNIAAVSGFIAGISIPEFILTYIKDNLLLLLLFILFAFCLLGFALRWCFCIHNFVLEEEDTIEAGRHSASMMKGRYLKVYLGILLWEIILTAAAAVASLILSAAAISVIKFIFSTDKAYSVSLITTYFIAFILIGSVSYFSVPLTFAHISTVYYAIKDEQEQSLPPLHVFKGPALSVVSRILLTGLCGILLLLNVLIWFRAQYDDFYYVKRAVNRLSITAHRGNSAQAPENSLPAFQQAIDAGADWIEMDVHQTRDGVIVVLHDDNLRRVAGVNKNIWELTYAQLQKYNTGSSPENGSIIRIPTLQEAVSLCRGKVHLNIELKPTGHEKNFEQEVLKIIYNNDLLDDCALSSSNVRTLRTLKDLDPQIHTIYITAVAVGDINKMDFADAFSIESGFITPALINNIHQDGKQVFAWTVNSGEQARHMIAMQVDGLITDQPAKIRQMTDSLRDNTPLERYVKLFFPGDSSSYKQQNLTQIPASKNSSPRD